MILTLLLAAAAAASPASRFDATRMMDLARLADPQLSPDGKWVAYQVTDVDFAAGTRDTDLWIVSSAPGGTPRRLTEDPASDTRPRWSPDGRRIAFVSAREGGSQAWIVDAAGGAARKVTSLATEAGGVTWIDDKTLLVTSKVHPDCAPGAAAGPVDEACQKQRLDAAGKPSSARVYDSLLFRHWDAWDDGRRSHLLRVPLDGGPVRDVTPGERDVPPFTLGGPDDWSVSPDGTSLAFVRNDDRVPATSTNSDVFVALSHGGHAVKVSTSAGYDKSPRFSPDGERIAFRSQERAGFEADRWRLMVYDRRASATRELTAGFDRQVGSFAWSPDSRTLYFVAADEGRQPIFAVAAEGGPVRTVATGATFDDLSVSPDGRFVYATKQTATHPAEIVRVSASGGEPEAVTAANDAFLAGFALRPAESVTYKGAGDVDVQAWIVKPADFDPAKKYPLLFLIHGGPQGAWGDAWSYRWNYQVFANAGYVVFAPNPRGSVGWGQKFTDEITLDWEGKVYEDLMRGADHAEALPYVDRARTAAAGASYGGYMVNWIAGHTDRFRALVSHDGIFDLRSMYASTEELWFVDWEFGGPPWERPEFYLRANPARFVSRFKTPTLVIHGEKDYRVPIEQGLQMFTALQLQGVPSRLLVFPDENHWVLKPANSVRWYEEVLGWLDRWTKP